ncbi:MAG TPA: TetR/AcrR family transcriptional regulator [Acidimicrobiia bacterium]|nr:TetR/AcrR family transcriptional regulator [Acidimicrobiia bacterium]
MGRYRAGIETRQRILTATRDALAESGLDGTTLKAICERAGVQPGSFYNLFPSKEEAVLTVVREAIEAVDPHPDGEGIDRPAELVEAFVRFLEGQPFLARVYLQIAVTGAVGDGHLIGRIRRHRERRVERFTDAIARDAGLTDRSEAQRRAELMLATLEGLAIATFLDPTIDVRKHAQSLI